MDGSSKELQQASADGGSTEEEFSSSSSVVSLNPRGVWRSATTKAHIVVRSVTLSLNKSEKQTVVADVAAQVARSQTLALAEYRGLTVAHLDVLRKQARDLPVKFVLDDAMAMSPAMKLSGFARVIVGARISRSGNATPQPRDLQGLSGIVASPANGVAVVIDTELPPK